MGTKTPASEKQALRSEQLPFRTSQHVAAARSPFHHLIYPVPHAAGLGIHATLDLGKRVRFGPDVEWIDRIDYSVNVARAPLFVRRDREAMAPIIAPLPIDSSCDRDDPLA